MTHDEMRQAVLRVLELPIPDRDEEREKWRLLVAEQIVDSLGLEQVGWFVWESPEDDEWSTVGLDYEDLHHFPHRPLYRLRGDR